ncbi:hypothetical protein TL16_g12025 [Triparma laevis f. inornata]|nr:hypothetical protein TL16_g12025 [Triparma laevis f. inornata]
MMNLLLLLPLLAGLAHAKSNDNYERRGVLTYNILDGGWSDEGQGPRLVLANGTASGPFANYILSNVSPYNNVVAFQELLNWSEDDMKSVTEAFGYSEHYLCQNCDGYHVGFMSRSKIEVLKDISTGGHGAIAARIDGIVYVTFHLTPFTDTEENQERLAQVDSVVKEIISKYSDEPLLLMGDTNNPSPLDLIRYDDTTVCENDSNYCMNGKINYAPIQYLLDAGLNDLCWYEYNVDLNSNFKLSYNQCSNSNPTSIWAHDIGSSSEAKIDYIFGNEKFIEAFGVVHSRVQISQATD